jgi:hypothetical protein
VNQSVTAIVFIIYISVSAGFADRSSRGSAKAMVLFFGGHDGILLRRFLFILDLHPGQDQQYGKSSPGKLRQVPSLLRDLGQEFPKWLQTVSFQIKVIAVKSRS